MKTRALWIALPALVLLPGSSPRADELLRFKSGYEMMVVSHREEKGMIIAKLDGGGEVGFPKESLLLLETGKPTQRTGPTPSGNRVVSIGNMEKRGLRSDLMPAVVRARGLNNSAQGVTMGYSFAGQATQRFSGGPIGEASTSGKIGMNVQDMRNTADGSPDPGTRYPKKAPIKKMELSGAGDED